MRTLLILLALVASPAWPITTFGNYDCAQWFTLNNVARPWLLGYLSGLSSMDPQDKVDVLGRLNSADQAFLWMDNYCKANPLDKISKGGNVLYLELMNRK